MPDLDSDIKYNNLCKLLNKNSSAVKLTSKIKINWKQISFAVKFGLAGKNPIEKAVKIIDPSNYTKIFAKSVSNFQCTVL